jgi:hypothetical protein
MRHEPAKRTARNLRNCFLKEIDIAVDACDVHWIVFDGTHIAKLELGLAVIVPLLLDDVFIKKRFLAG